MNDLRTQLGDAVETPSMPDVDELWQRGRRAVRRRTMVAGAAFAALVAIAGLGVAWVRDDSAPTDVVDSIDEDGLPVIEVPEGADVLWFPVGLPDGWTTEIRPLVEIPAWVIDMTLTSDDLAIAVHVVEPGPVGPVRLGATFPQSTPDDPSDPGVAWGRGDFNVAWSGGGFSGVAEAFGFTDDDLVLALVAAVVDSGLVDDPDAEPPTGWEVTRHTGGESAGGSSIHVATPDGVISVWTFLHDADDIAPPSADGIDPSFPAIETPIGTARVAEDARLIGWHDIGATLSLSWQDGTYADALTVATAMTEVAMTR